MPKKLPPRTLREWHWKALVQAYQSGEEGIASYYRSWNTWLRLRDYYDLVQGLVEEKEYGSREYRLHINPLGRWFYTHYYKTYRNLYLDVEAPEPDWNYKG